MLTTTDKLNLKLTTPFKRNIEYNEKTKRKLKKANKAALFDTNRSCFNKLVEVVGSLSLQHASFFVANIIIHSRSEVLIFQIW
jgi:hypothetical protein